MIAVDDGKFLFELLGNARILMKGEVSLLAAVLRTEKPDVTEQQETLNVTSFSQCWF